MERSREAPRPGTEAPQETKSLIERRPTATRMGDVALADSQREILNSVILSARRPADAPEPRVAPATPSKATAAKRPKPGTTALLSGSDRITREKAAAAVANALDVDLYRIDLGRVVSKYIGETEKNLNAVFDAAERSGAVLLFDEADALFGKRTDVKDAHDRYANLEVSYLLDRLESYDGVAILATNLKSNIDPAFTRRVRYLVELDDD